jgi:hypothetical protein
VKRAVVLLCRMLFNRPLIVVLLLLLYGVVVLLVTIIDSPKKAIGVLLMSAFATAGLTALLSERISRYSSQASVLALPNHARVMRDVQSLFLAVFVGLPIALSTILGINVLITIATLSTATAIGIIVASSGGIWLFLVIILSKVLPLGEWALLPPAQALAVVASSYLIWRWFGVSLRAEQMSLMSFRRADARHEQVSIARQCAGTEGSEHAGDWALAKMEAVTSHLKSDRIADALSLGFGYSTRLSWRGVWIGARIGFALQAVWLQFHGSHPRFIAYALVTAFCCLSLLGKLQGLIQRFLHTTAEQAVLALMPRWPDPPRIKRAIVATTLRVQRGGFLVWGISSLAEAAFGWLGADELLGGSVAILATSLALSGVIWAQLARRRIREWQFTSICIVLIVWIGAASIFFGISIGQRYWIGGLAAMLLPPALALVSYAIAPLRFPLQVDVSALKAVMW